MKAELIPLNGDPPIPITRDVTVVGRREFCDIQIADASLSKRHCVLVRTDGLLMIRDLVTTNGTKVNGQRVMWAALLPNDRLSLGGYKMRVYLGPDDAFSPSEQVNGRGASVAKPAARPAPSFPTPTPDPTTPPEAVVDDSDEEVIQLDDDDLLPDLGDRSDEGQPMLLLD